MTTKDAYIPRHVDGPLDLLLAELPAVMLTGPRACGKTTTALRRARSVIRLDRPDEASAFAAAPDAMLGAQQTPVLVDEWQTVPEVMGAVKRAVDTHSGTGRFLLTGSVRARVGGAGWPSTGRVVPLPMYGLTVAELLRRTNDNDPIGWLFGDEDPATGVLDTAPSLTDLLDHAVRGGFPDAVGLSDFARSAWHDGYVDQLIRHDVAELADVRSPAGMLSLLRAVALNTAGLPSLTTLAEAAGLTHQTVSSYLDLLEDLRVIERIPAWSSNRLSRLVKTPKYHIVDPGLAAHLAGDSQSTLLRSGDRLGRIMDTFAVAQLRPLLRLGRMSITAHHLRDANQRREVDLILESDAGQLVGIEIKAGSTIDPRDARHLEWLRDQLGEAFVRGIILHTGAATYPLAERIWAVPIAKIWR